LSDLFELSDAVARVRLSGGTRICTLEHALQHELLLAPCDLQALKATGVTFADSLIERVIEERAYGDPHAAAELRAELASRLGLLTGVRPGSAEAEEVRRILTEKGLWSQYLEVGIGPDAEIFTKAQPLSAVGCGAQIGLHPASKWSNSEPEIVLAVSSRGDIVGATLGNDLNLRDFEGRSALLLCRAKDNNASCAIGPFVRLFDGTFGLDQVRETEVHVCIDGEDGFHVEGTNFMRQISRDPEELVRAAIGPANHYPDGLMLFLGTMFVPTKDRQGPGSGFTHRIGDRVRISSPGLGALHNEVTTSDRAPPWIFGMRALAASLAARGLLRGTDN
jgi:fumarylacetoacetate (FAA) hydrolase family protein